MAQMIVDTGMDHGSDALYRPAQMLYAFTGTGMAQIPHGFMAQMLYVFTGMVMAQMPCTDQLRYRMPSRAWIMAQIPHTFTGMGMAQMIVGTGTGMAQMPYRSWLR